MRLKAFKLSSDFYRPFQDGSSFVDLFCNLCVTLVILVLSCLFLAALQSAAGKGLASCVLCFLVFLSLSHVVCRVRCGT